MSATRDDNEPTRIASSSAEGEMGARMRTLDWAQTPVGPMAAWPQSLRGTIKTLLASRYPMILLWGPERPARRG